MINQVHSGEVGTPERRPRKPWLKRVEISLKWLTFLAAAGAAAFAGAQAFYTREASEDGLRAFVVLKAIKVLPITNGNKDVAWQFIPVWENAGSTPTRDLHMHLSAWWQPGLLPGFTKTDIGPSEGTLSVLGPKATTNFPFITVPDYVIKLARQTPGLLRIWGWAKYKDIFWHSDRHSTRFCYIGSWINGHPDDAGSGLDIRYNLCPEGNCTDTECDAEGYKW